VPLDWAATQNTLGTALSTLGKSESATARLEEAVSAFRDALQEWVARSSKNLELCAVRGRLVTKAALP
jgi:hypothetical protein